MEHWPRREDWRALARPRTPLLRVRAEGEIEDRRVLGQGRRASHDLRKGEVVGPDKCQAIVKALELLLELLTPELCRTARTPSP